MLFCTHQKWYCSLSCRPLNDCPPPPPLANTAISTTSAASVTARCCQTTPASTIWGKSLGLFFISRCNNSWNAFYSSLFNCSRLFSKFLHWPGHQCCCPWQTPPKKSGWKAERAGPRYALRILARWSTAALGWAAAAAAIALNIDWSWNIFTSHNFCSMLIEQLIDLEKVRTDNLKFRTDLRDRVMDGWSVTQ